MKTSVSTSLEETDVDRVNELARLQELHMAVVLRKAIVRGLPILEAEILGVGYSPQPLGKKRKEAA